MVNAIACKYPDTIRSAAGGQVAAIERELLTANGQWVAGSANRARTGAHDPRRARIGERDAWVKFGVTTEESRAMGYTDELLLHMVQHEAAAYIVAKIIGMAEHVPIAVVRDLQKDSGGTAPCAVIINVPDNIEKVMHDGVTAEQIRRCAAFDYAIAMDDRLVRNWMITFDANEQPHLVLFDHGAAFGWIRFVDEDKREAVWNIEPRGSWVHKTAMEQHGGPAYEILAPLLEAQSMEALQPYLEQWQIDALVKRVRDVLPA